MYQQIRGRAAILFFFYQLEKHKLSSARWSFFPSSFAKIRSVVSDEKSKMSQSTSGLGCHLPIGPVKFRWIPVSGVKEEVENVKS